MDDFEHHYRQNLLPVYRYLYLRLNHHQTAEDLTSRTFLSAFENRQQYDPDKGNWQQWIMRIAKNRLIDYWRKRKISLSLKDCEQMEDLLESAPKLQDQLDDKLLFEKILDQTPKDLRHLLILRYVDDLTYEEIASMTGKSQAAVRKLFSRLHQKLNVRFSKFQFDL